MGSGDVSQIAQSIPVVLSASILEIHLQGLLLFRGDIVIDDEVEMS